MAGLIPQGFIDDLLGRIDIVEVVGARLKLKKTGKNYSALCPFHNEKTPSFTVNDEKVTAIETTFGCEQFTGDGVVIKKGKKVFHKAVLV